MKKVFSYFICILLMHVATKAQMKIGDNATTINSASLLELETTNKGLVFPRVALSNVASSSPLPSGLLTGTVVYNTNASITNGNGAGLYIWGGTSWTSLSQNIASYAWSLTGNAGTNPSLNFIGTTDNTGFHVRTNNIERMWIDSLGDVAIGSTSFNTSNRERLLVNYGTTTSHTVANYTGKIDDYFQMNIQNTSNGINASSDYVATADDGTDSTYYIDMGINSSTFAPSVENWGGPHDGYLYANSRNLVIGTQANNSDVIFLLGGGRIKNNAVLRLNGVDGNIVVGKGESTGTPVGNTLRGPNANGTNIAGGGLTLQGGSATGTAAGGNLNVYGGSTVSGSYGLVNINNNTNSATNINTGTSGSNITLGGLANNIILPKFTSVGGLYYTSLSTGQISTTGSDMIWDSVNNRLGIGITSPGYKLSVLSSSNPLYLSGVQATGSFSTDSILTILNGIVKKAPYSSLPGISAWTLTGNSGTTPGTNFVGTTDSKDLVFKTNATEVFRATVNGNIGIGTTSPGNKLSVLASSNPLYLSGLQATATLSTDSVLTVNAGVVKKASYASIASSFWGVTGNSGTSLTTNFLGTTDEVGLSFRTNNIQRMLITSSGNVGIGLSNPSNALSVLSSSNPLYLSGVQATGTFTTDSMLTILNGVVKKAPYSSLPGSNAWTITGNSGTTPGTNFVGTTDAKDFVFKTNSSEVFRATSGGNIGLGITSPNYKLSVLSASDPLYLSGVQATTTFTTDSVLTILNGVVKKTPYSSLPGAGSGWSLTGNSISSGNFLGTTNAQALVLKANNVQMGYFDGNVSSLTLGVGAVNNSSDHNVAIGYNASTNNQYTLALGYNATASGVRSIAIGNGASATTAAGAEAIAMGYNATAKGDQAISIGYQATNGASYGVTIGYAASTSALQATAIGYKATASAQYANAIGYSAQASGLQSTAIGYNAQTSQSNTILLGDVSTPNLYVGIGTATPTAKLHIVGGTTTNYPLQLVGLPTGVSGTDNILTVNSSGVVGYLTPSTFNGTYWSLSGNAPLTSSSFLGTTNTIPLQFKFNSTLAGYLDANNTSFGTSAGATSGTNNTAIGYSATASNSATAVGASAVASVINNVAIGNSALANSGSQATAVGGSSQALFQNNVAIGYSAQATTSSQETVVGASAQAQGQNNIAIGYTAKANGSDKITVVGSTAQASFQNNTVVGYAATAISNNQSTAVGASSVAGAQNTTALGYNAKAQATNSTAIGYNASTSQANALILGDATSTVNVGIGTATPNTTAKLDVDGYFKFGDNGTVNKNLVSFSATLGSTNLAAGIGNTIVLAGTVTFQASSTDVTVTIPSSSNYLTSTRASVSVSPNFDLPTGVSIASARMISSSQVKIRIVNATTDAQTISGQLYVTINEF